MGSKLDELEKENSAPIVQPTYIVCEGKSDAAFFFRLVRDRTLNGFQVGWAEGKDKFGSYLNGLRPRTSPSLQRIILARDCDEDPSAAFAHIVAQIRLAVDHPYPVPTQARVMATGGSPHIGILMIPDTGRQGVLETLFVESVRQRNGTLFNCVENYARCAGTNTWPIDKYSKMQLASIVAASCNKNPGCSLTTIWTEPGNPISLQDTCFTPIADYLRQFAI